MVNPSKISGNSQYKQGYYKLVNPNKCIGGIKDGHVIYRSSLELAFTMYLDVNENVIKWSTESIVVPYVLDNKIHRYFIDYYYQTLSNDDNLVQDVMVEIKPSSEVNPPIRPKNETMKALKNYEYSIGMYRKNISKWKHAKEFAEKRGMVFVIITEEHMKKKGIIK